MHASLSVSGQIPNYGRYVRDIVGRLETNASHSERQRKQNIRPPERIINKNPAGRPAGLFFGVGLLDYRPWADIEKLKLSKVFSATRNHRFWSARKAFRLS